MELNGKNTSSRFCLRVLRLGILVRRLIMNKNKYCQGFDAAVIFVSDLDFVGVLGAAVNRLG
jgi:hypothetical protein